MRVQNLVLAFGSIAALALPAVLGFIPLGVAVALHEGATVLVVLNSLRLLRAAQQAPHAGLDLKFRSAVTRDASLTAAPANIAAEGASNDLPGAAAPVAAAAA